MSNPKNKTFKDWPTCCKWLENYMEKNPNHNVIHTVSFAGKDIVIFGDENLIRFMWRNRNNIKPYVNGTYLGLNGENYNFPKVDFDNKMEMERYIYTNNLNQ